MRFCSIFNKFRVLRFPQYVHFREYAEMHHPLDHATGLEKKELLAALAGNCDPYRIMAIKRGPGTREQPNLVPSAFNKRIVGCICNEHHMHVEYMWLHKDDPKRCGCGYWFELCPVPSFV